MAAIYADEWKQHRPVVQFLDDASYPMRYVFAMGSALFISLDDTIVGRLPPAQMAWLDAQLTKHAKYPIKIVYGHVPLYAFTGDAQVVGDAALEALLNKHGVSMFLSGHTQAFYPGRRGNLRLYSTSCLGGGPVAVLGTSTPSPRSVLIIDIEGDRFTTLEAHSGAAFDAPIARASLPASIGSGASAIARDPAP
jgi:hypothetical protein